MRVTGHRQGFSLIEATVAVAVLALGCLAVTSVLSVSLRAEARLAAGRGAAEALDAECARLRALPFFLQSGGPGLGPSSLLSELFPHARPWLDAEYAQYRADAGTFVTAGRAGSLRLTRTACFETWSGGQLAPLPAGDVQGWAVWDASRPPAAVLSVHLEVAGPGGTATVRELVVYALRPATQAAGTVHGGGRRAC